MEALERGDGEFAEALFRESWDASPHFKTAERLGRLLKERGEIQESILWLAASIGLGHRSGPARVLVAELLVELGEEFGAWNQVKKALEENPGFRKAKALAAELEKHEDIRFIEGWDE